MSDARFRWGVGSAVAFLFAVLVLPANRAVAFVEPTDRGGVLREAVLGWVFLGLLAAAIAFGLKFVERVRVGDPVHRYWLFTSVAYLVPVLIVFVLVYPGEFISDEFGILDQVRAYSADAWQGYLTYVFYTSSMLLFPSAVTVVVVQIVIGALAVGRLSSVLYRLTGRRWIAAVVVIPMLSPVVLFQLMYPMRLIPYTLILMLVIAELIDLRFAPTTTEGPIGRFLALGAAVCVLATWRPEGLVLLVLLPCAFVLLRLRHAPRRRVVAATLSVLGLLGILLEVNSATSDPAYKVVPTVNPLSTMVSGPLVGPHLQQDLAAIDAVMPLSTLRKYPSYTEVYAYWFGGPRPGFKQHLDRYYPAVLDLIITNPGPFMDNRVHSFLAANSLDQVIPIVHPEHFVQPDYGHDLFAGFADQNPLGSRIAPVVRYETLRDLVLLSPADGSMTVATRALWNAIPAVVVALGLLVVTLIRRKWFWALVSGAVIAQAGVVFLTAPGSYFMYYFPIFVIAPALLASALVISFLGPRERSRTPSSERDGRRTRVPWRRPGRGFRVGAVRVRPEA